MPKAENPRAVAGGNSGAFASAELKGFVESIESIDIAKEKLAGQRRDVFVIAKAKGYDAAVIREVLKRRKKDRDDLQEWDEMVALYEGALTGVLA
jgi:uncharacterized protein (UPF0335 family)